MAKDHVIDIGPKEFSANGLVVRPDTTAAPIGSFRVMRNAIITQRGGISPRPGTLLLGNANPSTFAIKGFYNFRKSNGSDEILVKTYNDRIEYISKNYPSIDWSLLKSGFTADAEFGFVSSLVNTGNQDYLIGSNRYDPYFLWNAPTAALSITLIGGETTVTVDTILLPDIYQSLTATSNSATTIDVSTATWAVSQWVGFYVHIPGTGKVRKITANTATQITFDTLGSGPGNVAFQIRQTSFPATGTLVYNGNTVAYSAIDTSTTFVVSAAVAGTSGMIVTTQPTDYVAAPRGNRLCNYLARIVVGNVRSALTRDTGGALQGYAAAGTVFVSKLNTPSDFSYAATRVAGEGDAISMPYGGGDITDVQTQEDTFYAFKERYIESVQYSQDTNDLAVRTPLKSGFGSIGKTVKATDDIFFFTADKQLTSIGRIKLKDVKPQSLNIGDRIVRFLEASGIDNTIGRGKQIGEKIYFPIKLTSASTSNDIMLVLNKNTNIFEGIWDLPAFGIEMWNSKHYYAESNGPDVYQMFYQHADVRGSDRFGIDFEVATHFMNLTASKSNEQASSGIYIEGYVAGGASFTFKNWADFAVDPFLTFSFSFDENGFLDGETTTASLAGRPLAIDPSAATYGDPMDDGRRHFSFIVRFPYTYGNYFSFGFNSSDADNDYEITRAGLFIKESPTMNQNQVKTL